MRNKAYIERLFFLAFMLCGVWALGAIFYHLSLCYQASKWERTEATILSAAVHVKYSRGHRMGNARSHHIVASYSYTYQGIQYLGSKAGISDRMTFELFLESRLALLQEHVASKDPIIAYVNPSNPSEAYLFVEPNWGFIHGMMLVVICFGGVGLGGILLIGKSLKSEKEIEQRKARYPNEPWKWEAEWENGRIKPQSKPYALSLWAFTIFWNTLSSPLVYIIPRELGKGENLQVVIGVYFPLIGFGLLVLAIRSSIRLRRFGSAILDLDQLPGVIGGKLKGSILLSRPIKLDGSATVSISCFEHNVHYRQNSCVPKRILHWKHSYTLPLLTGAQSRHQSIPIECTIPYSCLETNAEKDIQWIVEVEAETKGTDFFVRYEVPVFKTESSDPSISDPELADEFLNSEPTPPKDSKIRLTSTGDGITLYAPPFALRSPKNFFVMLLAFLFCSSALWVTLYANGPLPFLIFFGSVELLILTSLIYCLFCSTKITVTSNKLIVSSRFLIFKSSKQYSKAEISEIHAEHTNTSRVNTIERADYTIRITTQGPKGHKKKPLLRYFSDRNEARYIANQMKSALGLSINR